MDYIYIKVGKDGFLVAASTNQQEGFIEKAVDSEMMGKIMQNPRAFFLDQDGLITHEGWPDHKTYEDYMNDLKNCNEEIENLKKQLKASNNDNAKLINQISTLQTNDAANFKALTLLKLKLNQAQKPVQKQETNNSNKQNQALNTNNNAKNVVK